MTKGRGQSSQSQPTQSSSMKRGQPKQGQSMKKRGQSKKSSSMKSEQPSGPKIMDLRDHLEKDRGAKVKAHVKVRHQCTHGILRFLTLAALVAKISQLLASLGIPPIMVPCLVDGQNQTWALEMLKEFNTQFAGMSVYVVASQTAMSTLLSKMLSHFVKVIVPDGDPSMGEVEGVHEDGMVGGMMKVNTPMILVSGDCKTKKGERQLYDGMCWRLTRGLITIVIARKKSCSDELKLLQTLFPRTLIIIEVDLTEFSREE